VRAACRPLFEGSRAGGIRTHVRTPRRGLRSSDVSALCGREKGRACFFLTVSCDFLPKFASGRVRAGERQMPRGGPATRRKDADVDAFCASKPPMQPPSGGKGDSNGALGPPSNGGAYQRLRGVWGERTHTPLVGSLEGRWKGD
jgi:hypothetical protein